MKKILSIFLVTVMLLTTVVVSAAHYTDIDGHWAKNEIEAWSEYGVISGYNGEFSPNRNITRGEFAVVLNRLMSYQKESANIFKDLPDKFYTSSVLKLFAAGVMQGYEGSISPEASLTREEASIMICRALGIETADIMTKSFADEADISTWAKPYINAMVNAGLLNGANGRLNPKNPIMRSEVVKILDNTVNPILKTGTFENIDTNKILVISSGDVIVKNAKLSGKIIVTQGVLTGKISFADAKIEGDVVIDNDRSAFIELKNTTVSNKDILTHKAIIKESAGGSAGSAGGSGSSSGNVSPGVGGSSGGNGNGNQGGSNENTGDSEVDGDTGNTGEDSEMVKKLKAVSEEIALYTDRNLTDFYNVFSNEEKYMLTTIKTCIDDAVANHKDKLTADFIRNTYNTEITQVQADYDQMVQNGQDNAFIGKMAANFTIYNLVWLADTLGIDLEAYGINPNDFML